MTRLLLLACFSALALLVQSVPAGAQGKESDAAKRLHFIITIDTETWTQRGPDGWYPTSLETDILGEVGGKAYGISLMMDLLEKRGMKATFFVNAFLGSYYPEDRIQAFVTEILNRGHDVQLHPHVEFMCFQSCEESDRACLRKCTKEQSFLSGNSYENQREIISEAAENLTRWTGQYPVAFRSGGLDADEVTIQVLRDLNIAIDSSLNLPSHELHSVFPLNKVSERDGVIEVPEFTYNEDVLVTNRYAYLDIDYSTLEEHKALINSALENDVRTAVLVMHSFSFCSEVLGCPDTATIDRFDKLLSYIEASGNIEVVTMGAFLERYRADPARFVGSGYVPKIGYFMILEKSFRKFGEKWEYTLFASANVAAVVIAVGVVLFVLLRRTRRRQPA